MSGIGLNSAMLANFNAQVVASSFQNGKPMGLKEIPRGYAQVTRAIEKYKAKKKLLSKYQAEVGAACSGSLMLGLRPSIDALDKAFSDNIVRRNARWVENISGFSVLPKSGMVPELHGQVNEPPLVFLLGGASHMGGIFNDLKDNFSAIFLKPRK